MSFATDIAKFHAKYRSRLRAVGRYAVQDTVEMAQRTVGQGGRMRVKTGFLRASIQAAIGHMPAGPTRGAEDANYPEGMQVAGEPVVVTLLRWDPGEEQTLFVGWTANYARFREYNDGFMRGAVEKWQTTVNKSVARVRREMP